MRIAISGSHVVGKTSLAEALAEALPHYELVPEPYYLLEEDGYEFSDPPSIEDYERQLERSVQCLADSGPDTVFDRSPLDLLGYVATHRDAEAFQIEEWQARVREAVQALDLIVFVPIEDPDRVGAPRAQGRLRARVDAALRDIVVDDAYELGHAVLVVAGAPEARLRQVLTHVGRATGQPIVDAGAARR